MFWRDLPMLKTLQEVSFMWYTSPDTIPKEALRFLSTRSSVRIMNSPHTHQLASLIGSSVSEITHYHHTRFNPFNEEQLCDLRNLTRLKKVCFKIEEGPDKVLPQVVEKLPELTTLDILWVRTGFEAREPCRYSGSCFAAASLGIMLRTVKGAPLLPILHMTRVRILLVEIHAILKSIGRRLLVFETSIGDQEECPFDRLAALLLTAAEHNTNLQGFAVEDIAHKHRSPWRNGSYRRNEHLQVWKSLVSGLRTCGLRVWMRSCEE